MPELPRTISSSYRWYAHAHKNNNEIFTQPILAMILSLFLSFLFHFYELEMHASDESNQSSFFHHMAISHMRFFFAAWKSTTTVAIDFWLLSAFFFNLHPFVCENGEHNHFSVQNGKIRLATLQISKSDGVFPCWCHNKRFVYGILNEFFAIFA